MSMFQITENFELSPSKTVSHCQVEVPLKTKIMYETMERDVVDLSIVDVNIKHQTIDYVFRLYSWKRVNILSPSHEYVVVPRSGGRHCRPL